jgi:hypothetical protein
LARITRERAERIARAHACEQCGEYSYKRLSVKPALKEHKTELNIAWQAVKTCGICGMQQELGIDDEGEIVYVA